MDRYAIDVGVAPATRPVHRRWAATGGWGGLAVLATSVLVVFTAAVAWPWSPAGTLRFIAAVTYLVAGAVAHFRWPDNRTGRWMVAASAGLLLESLSAGWPPAHGLAAFGDVSTPLILTLGLAFPSGRLNRTGMALVGAEWLIVLGEPLARQVGLIDDRLRAAADVGEALLCVAVIVVLARRYTAATAPLRRGLAPGYAVGAAALLIGFVIVGADLLHSQPFHDVLIIAFGVLRAALPISFLAGLVVLRREGAVGALITQLVAAGSQGSLDELVRRTLGDPTARVLMSDQAPGTVQRTPGLTPIAFGGNTIGMLQHDPDVDDSAVRSVSAAVGLALYNARLREDVERRTAELAAAASRLVEATDVARRQVERNLHDGAQQRLVAVGVQLRLLQVDLAERGAATDARAVGEIAENLSGALSELRTLASGMHPAILAQGLVPALQALAAGSPLSVTLVVRGGPADQLSSAVAVTLYYAAAEALTNSAKHSGARRARIDVDVGPEMVSVTITDDGSGGADATGAGVLGIRDRTRLLGGDVRLRDTAAGGTELTAFVPQSAPASQVVPQ